MCTWQHLTPEYAALARPTPLCLPHLLQQVPNGGLLGDAHTVLADLLQLAVVVCDLHVRAGNGRWLQAMKRNRAAHGAPRQ